jgi:hypothetical protein
VGNNKTKEYTIDEIKLVLSKLRPFIIEYLHRERIEEYISLYKELHGKMPCFSARRMISRADGLEQRQRFMTSCVFNTKGNWPGSYICWVTALTSATEHHPFVIM